MKHLIIGCAFILVNSLSANAQKLYGKKFDVKAAMPVKQLQEKMKDKQEMPVIVKGEIVEVCQVAGCWITLKNEGGDNIFVKIKDHEFAVPTDMSGHKVTVNGTAVRKTVSVEELKHYAEDAGKSEEEIAKITEPKSELRINASSMVIE